MNTVRADSPPRRGALPSDLVLLSSLSLVQTIDSLTRYQTVPRSGIEHPVESR